MRNIHTAALRRTHLSIRKGLSPLMMICILSGNGLGTSPLVAQSDRYSRIDDHFTTRLTWRRPIPRQPHVQSPVDLQTMRFNTIDGSYNNLRNPRWGVAGANLWRIVPSSYADGVSEPARADQPSPREISNLVCEQTDSIPNSMGLTDMVWQWGQFIDHDLDLTETSPNIELFPIPVPSGDPWFDPNGSGNRVIMLLRSAYNPYTGISTPREQLNFITAWLDGSQIYGSDEETANSLRQHRNGMLRVSGNQYGQYLPVDADGFFLAGDIRANEQVYLTAMHTLFVREHNRQCREMKKLYPHLADQQLYLNARKQVIATIQSITFNEFLPAILGPGALPRYRGYNDRVYPGVTNTFSTAAFRFGHTMLNSELLRLNGNLQSIPEGNLQLADAFFQPDAIRAVGIEPYLSGLARQRAQKIDGKIVDDVRNFLFGQPGAGGFDLASLNIQRGRDHGLSDINTIRRWYGLPRHRDFMDLTDDSEVQSKLHSLYGSVDNVDPWVAMLCEDHFPGAAIGQTAWFVISDQFTRLRDGDRFWYQNQFPPAVVQRIEQTKLNDIIRLNTSQQNLQRDLFHLPTGQ